MSDPRCNDINIQSVTIDPNKEAPQSLEQYPASFYAFTTSMPFFQNARHFIINGPDGQTGNAGPPVNAEEIERKVSSALRAVDQGIAQSAGMKLILSSPQLPFIDIHESRSCEWPTYPHNWNQ